MPLIHAQQHLLGTPRARDGGLLGEALGPAIAWGGTLVLVATGLVTGFNPLQWLAALRSRQS